MAWPVIGRSFSPEEFREYVKGLKWGDAFRPTFTCLHNTASPSLAQRPAGLTKQHILNLQAYYRDEKGWNGGPHLFIDDKAIWVFNDLTKFGTHSPSWNGVALGIEMLGDFDCESFTSGRGLKVRANAVAAVAALNNALGFKADAFKFHIEDKKSDHACPGKLARAERSALIAEIAAAMNPAPAHVAEAEPESHIDTKAVNLADAEPAATKSSMWDGMSFAQLNELADQGSRVAGWIRSVKRWFWGGAAATAGSTSALMQTNAGTKHALLSLIEAHPFLFVGLVVGITAVVVYAAIKMVEKYLLTAHARGDYRPRGG